MDTFLSNYSECCNSNDCQIFIHWSFFIIGVLGFAANFTLIIIYFSIKSLRMHPNGILISLYIINLAISSKYLVNGWGFYLSQEKLSCKGFDYNFFDFKCILEGNITFFAIIFNYIWSFIWLYDLRISFKKPMHSTDSNTYFYIVFAFLSLFIIWGIFFILEKVFMLGDFLFGEV